ncbi:MAG: hypothetical protein E7623_02900 [Ruminococcaceae bacterium]|nr:hypothetical protein [Oscillospiraceae bacterium]
MKKIVTLLLCTIFVINCSALSVGDGSFDYIDNDTQITVEFASDSALSAEKQQQIADHIVYGDDGASTYSWCWLTGHNYVTEAVYVIQHKIFAASPRCIKRTYAVDTCTKCDYLEETLVSQVRIICCDEG